MVLDRHRRVLDWWLVPLSRLFVKVHPDVFTWLSLLCAFGAGTLFALAPLGEDGILWMLGAFVCVGLNSIFDLMDGKIANMTGKASPRGDFLDHAVDRFSDVLMLGGLALGKYVHIQIGLAALAATLLTSYLGTQAQAVGLRRNYGGLLGRADRMVLLLAVPLLEALWAWKHWEQPWQPQARSFLDLLLYYFAVVGGLTMVQRFVSSLRAFDEDGQLK